MGDEKPVQVVRHSWHGNDDAVSPAYSQATFVKKLGHVVKAECYVLGMVSGHVLKCFLAIEKTHCMFGHRVSFF